MVAFVRILVDDEDWIRFNRKGKLPSAAVDSRVATVLQTAFAARLAHYPTTLQVRLTCSPARTLISGRPAVSGSITPL